MCGIDSFRPYCDETGVFSLPASPSAKRAGTPLDPPPSGWGWVLRFLLGLLGIGMVGLIDYLTGKEIAVSVFYLLPILIVTWWLGVRAGIVTSFLSATTWWGVEQLMEAHYSLAWIPVWNACVRLAFFLVISVQLGRIRYLTQNLEGLVQARTIELAAEIERRRQVEAEVAEVSRREQTRLSHELHDHLGAHLAGIAFRSKAVAETLERRGLGEAVEAQRVTALVNGALDQLRGFARWLSPVEDSEGGLTAGLSRLGVEFETLFGITCLVELSRGLPEIDTEHGRQLYRIAQEAVRNAVKHGRAQWAEIRLDARNGMLLLRVSTDGEAWQPSVQSVDGLGLRIMEYRARMLGGTLKFSARAGGGCITECGVSLEGAATPVGVSSYESNKGPGRR